MEVEGKDSSPNSLGHLKVAAKDRFHGKKLKQSTRELLEEVCDDFENLEKYASSISESQSSWETFTILSTTTDDVIDFNKNLNRNLTHLELSNVTPVPQTELFNKTRVVKPVKNVINNSMISFENKKLSSVKVNISKTGYHSELITNKAFNAGNIEKTNSNKELLAEILRDFENIGNCGDISALKSNMGTLMPDMEKVSPTTESKDNLENTSLANISLPKTDLSKKENELETLSEETYKDSESRIKTSSKELLAEILRDFENMENRDSASILYKRPDQKLDNVVEESTDCSKEIFANIAVMPKLSKSDSKFESISVPLKKISLNEGNKDVLKKDCCNLLNLKICNSKCLADKTIGAPNLNNDETLNKGMSDLLSLTGTEADLLNEPVNKETATDENIYKNMLENDFVSENEFISRILISKTNKVSDMQVVSSCNIDSEAILVLPTTCDSHPCTVSEFADVNLLQTNNSFSDTVINLQLIKGQTEKQNLENGTKQQSSESASSFQSPKSLIEITIKSSSPSETYSQVYKSNKSFPQKPNSVNELISSYSDQDSEKQDSNDNEYFPQNVEKHQPHVTPFEKKTGQKEARKYSGNKSPVAKARRITSKMKAEWIKELKECGHLRCPMIGCFQSYVSVNSFEAHYKWCTGNDDLKPCPYCKSLIFASFSASLHHMNIKHPEKVEEYQANVPNVEVIFLQESVDHEAKLNKTHNEGNSIYTPNNPFSKKASSNLDRNLLNKTEVSNLKEFEECINLDNISSFKCDTEAAETEQKFKNATNVKIFESKKNKYIKKKYKTKGILFSERHKRFIETLKLNRDCTSERKTYTRPILKCSEDSPDKINVQEEPIKTSNETHRSVQSKSSSLQIKNSLVANILSIGFPDTINKLGKCIDGSIKNNSDSDKTQVDYNSCLNDEQSVNLKSFTNMGYCEGNETMRDSSLLTCSATDLEESIVNEANRLPNFDCLNASKKNNDEFSHKKKTNLKVYAMERNIKHQKKASKKSTKQSLVKQHQQHEVSQTVFPDQLLIKHSHNDSTICNSISKTSVYINKNSSENLKRKKKSLRDFRSESRGLITSYQTCVQKRKRKIPKKFPLLSSIDEKNDSEKGSCDHKRRLIRRFK
nr:uncharacterized protein LOC107438020 [Parasteatoda tepidariorum]